MSFLAEKKNKIKILLGSIGSINLLEIINVKEGFNLFNN